VVQPRLGKARQILDRITRPDVATVWRKSIVSDGAGGQTDTYAVVATYSCSMTPSMISPREVEQTAAIQVISLWQLHLPYDADVVPTDRLVVGTRTFEVVRSSARTVDVDLVVHCVEIL